MSALNAPLDEQIFIALQAYEQIKHAALSVDSNSHNADEKSARLSFNDIVNCVKLPSDEASVAALAVINSHLDYRRKYRFVLMQMSLLQSPRLIAASSEQKVLQRIDEQFSIGIEALNDSQMVVVLKLMQASLDAADANTGLPAYLHCETQRSIEVLTLKGQPSGEFTAKLSKSDARLNAFTNVNSHIYVTF